MYQQVNWYRLADATHMVHSEGELFPPGILNTKTDGKGLVRLVGK
jgi:hypothetical protein